MLLTETITLYPKGHINTINTVRERGGEVNIRAGDKHIDCESDHSAPSDSKVKNEWRYTSTPPICLYVVQRDIFNCLANFSVKILSNEADSSSASQEIISILWKPNVQYRIQKIPLLFHILSQISPVYALSP